jgi:hypothetical protein
MTNGTNANCANMPGSMQNTPATAPMTGTMNMNALTNNPNGPDWLAKFNRPNIMERNNYLGTTGRTHMKMTKCHYVMENGKRTKVCK